MGFVLLMRRGYRSWHAKNVGFLGAIVAIDVETNFSEAFNNFHRREGLNKQLDDH